MKVGKMKAKKPLYKRWWVIPLIFFGVVWLIALLTTENPHTEPTQFLNSQEKTKETTSSSVATNPNYDFEMPMKDIFNTFDGLTELQQEEKLKEFKGKRIKTSIYASKIDKASLSTQYVVMEMYDYPYNLIPYAKAFFPAEEKAKLLNVNIGDRIIFSGEFVNYNKGGLTSYIEFTDSKLIEINKTNIS